MKKFIGIFFVFAMMLSCMTACVENPESETAVYAARTERAGTEGNPVVIEYDSLDRKIKETCFYFVAFCFDKLTVISVRIYAFFLSVRFVRVN